MRILLFAVAFLIAQGLTYSQLRDTTFEKMAVKCESFNSGKYKVMPYIELGGYLQNLGMRKAIEVLSTYAKTQKYEDQIIVLTRMLINPKPYTTMRRPMLGAAHFMGGTEDKHWVLEPIQIVKNIPFLITQGYTLGGQAETSLSYLQYSIEFGEWSKNTYNVKPEDLKTALDILCNSSLWITPLTAIEKDFLEKQIR